MTCLGIVWRPFPDGVALKATVGQASCLSMNDGQDARPTKMAVNVENATPHGATIAEHVTAFRKSSTKSRDFDPVAAIFLGTIQGFIGSSNVGVDTLVRVPLDD